MHAADHDQLAYFERSFTNLSPTPEQIEQIEAIRAEYKSVLVELIDRVPRGRCRSVALTHLEESLMYAVKGVVGVDS